MAGIPDRPAASGGLLIWKANLSCENGTQLAARASAYIGDSDAEAGVSGWMYPETC